MNLIISIKTLITKGKAPVKIFTDDIEHQAYQQLLNISQLPFIHNNAAAMPAVHFGKGAIIPAAVGVDIGCGMYALRQVVCVKG